MLLFRPRSLPEQQRRYPAALIRVYDHRDFVDGDNPNPPSSRAEHVFDFGDGLRLIVSRERALDGTLQVHISASAVEDTTCYREASAKGVDWFLSYAVGRWQQLAQLSTEPDFLGLTAGKGVPHWFVRVAS